MPNIHINKERACPVCGSTDYTLFTEEKIDERKINTFTYASRKEPEFMCLRLVCCTNCAVVYASHPPHDTYLEEAYTEADFDSVDEAACAAQTYAKYLRPYVDKLQQKQAAVDVGAGSGPLLPLFDAMGFDPAIGIEPSVAAINAASDEIKPRLRQGMFAPALIRDLTPSLICSFMTLEHIETPGVFVKTAYESLHDGGMIAVVVHNRSGLLNRILGLKSPIIDVEHLQLFNPDSIHVLLEIAGFKNIQIIPIHNKYPLRYWIRLLPLSLKIKQSIIKLLGPVANKNVSINVGNLLAIGYK